jgi:hypothetical protein
LGLQEVGREKETGHRMRPHSGWFIPPGRRSRVVQALNIRHQTIFHFLLMAELQEGAWRSVALVSGDDVDRIMNPLPVWTYFLVRYTTFRLSALVLRIIYIQSEWKKKTRNALKYLVRWEVINLTQPRKRSISSEQSLP